MFAPATTNTRMIRSFCEVWLRRNGNAHSWYRCSVPPILLIHAFAYDVLRHAGHASNVEYRYVALLRSRFGSLHPWRFGSLHPRRFGSPHPKRFGSPHPTLHCCDGASARCACQTSFFTLGIFGKSSAFLSNSTASKRVPHGLLHLRQIKEVAQWILLAIFRASNFCSHLFCAASTRPGFIRCWVAFCAQALLHPWVPSWLRYIWAKPL